MELAKNLGLLVHFIGLAMILGPFFVNMRAHTNFGFAWVLAGAVVQLVSGSYLTVLAEMGLANDPDDSVNHLKIGVKLILAVVILVVAVIARRRVKRTPVSYARRKVLPLLHISGALALTNVALAVLWH